MHTSSKGEIHAGVWGLAAGVVGSLCCIGPSAAILLGLGASSALVGWSVDRALALGGGAALLLAGALLAWRRSRACDMRSAARWRSPALMLASFALAYGLLGVLAPELAARREDAAAEAAPRQALIPPSEQVAAVPLRQLKLSVEKMYCPPCAAAIRGVLKRQPSVRAVFAEAGNDAVTIDYDSSRTSAQKLAALIPAHYGVTFISDQQLH
jgi:copper chaperone CopZ